LAVYEHVSGRPVEALAVGVHLWASWVDEIMRYFRFLPRANKSLSKTYCRCKLAPPTHRPSACLKKVLSIEHYYPPSSAQKELQKTEVHAARIGAHIFAGEAYRKYA